MLDVLLIDDDELVRQSLHLLLTHEGFQVTCAEGGDQALELAREQLYEVVISDIRMPGMDGFETISQLRQLLPEANFVLITGYSELDAPVQALRLKVDDFFRKPFDLRLFLERIRQIRRQRKQRKVKGEDQNVDAFISLLRRLPDYAARTDQADEVARKAGHRLGLEEMEIRALRTAVRFIDVASGLREGGPITEEDTHTSLERSVQLLAQATNRPIPRNIAAQLVAAIGARLAGRPLEGMGLDALIQEEVSLWEAQVAPASEHAGEPADDVRIVSLGETRIFLKGQEIAAPQWESSRARWLFLYLVSRRGQWISADKLRDLFWPDSEPEKAQRSLVSTVHRCRKALRDTEAILRTDRGYCVNGELNLWWDVDQLQRLVRQSKTLEPHSRECATLLRQVENLYQGSFAPECSDEWANFVRDDLDRIALQALEALGRLLLESDPVAAEGRARKILRQESTDEGAADILLRALWAQGRRDEAIRFYRDFGIRMERELNLPPAPELVRTYLQLTQLS